MSERSKHTSEWRTSNGKCLLSTHRRNLKLTARGKALVIIRTCFLRIMELTLRFLHSTYRRLLFGPMIILMLSNPNTSRFPLKKTNSKNYTFTCLMEKDTKRPSKNYVIKDVLALISTQHSRSALPLK